MPSLTGLQLPINHDDLSVGTYKNRYWVNDDYFEPGGPVILYDVGESNAEFSVSQLTSDLTFLSKMLDEFKAIGIIWEHRLAPLLPSGSARSSTRLTRTGTMVNHCHTLSPIRRHRSISNILPPPRLSPISLPLRKISVVQPLRITI